MGKHLASQDPVRGASYCTFSSLYLRRVSVAHSATSHLRHTQGMIPSTDQVSGRRHRVPSIPSKNLRLFSGLERPKQFQLVRKWIIDWLYIVNPSIFLKIHLETICDFNHAWKTGENLLWSYSSSFEAQNPATRFTYVAPMFRLERAPRYTVTGSREGTYCTVPWDLRGGLVRGNCRTHSSFDVG